MINSACPVGVIPQKTTTVEWKPYMTATAGSKDAVDEPLLGGNCNVKPLAYQPKNNGLDVTPKFGKSFGKGILFKLQQLIPLYGSYKIGKDMIEQDRLQEALETGKPVDKSKIGFFKAWAKGFGMKFASSLPIIGSYLVGKEMIEQDRLKESLETGKPLDTSKVGFLKAWAKGFGMKFASSLPIIGSYLVGKEIQEQNNMTQWLTPLK